MYLVAEIKYAFPRTMPSQSIKYFHLCRQQQPRWAGEDSQAEQRGQRCCGAAGAEAGEDGGDQQLQQHQRPQQVGDD